MTNQACDKTFQYSDVDAFVGNVRLGKIDEIIWTLSVEKGPNGESIENPKRVLVGSAMMAPTKFERHALLEEVFKTTLKKIVRPAEGTTLEDIETAARMHRQATPEGVKVTPGNHEIKAIGYESEALRVESYLQYFQERSAEAAQVAATQQTAPYPDAIPPFDLHLHWIEDGVGKRVTFYGLQITQETGEFNNGPEENRFGFTFVALAPVPENVA